MPAPTSDYSAETILTFDNRDLQSDWSMVWSTANVPTMGTARGTTGTDRREAGRRRLRLASLALCTMLTMHCRLTATALTGSFLVFMSFLTIGVMVLANPMRHFEVFLGQWSISGPGRAFRIIPMFDGIGVAMGVNAIIRAIHCCAVAAIAAIYVIHSISDDKLPFTYCRDFNLKPYEPDLTTVLLDTTRFSRSVFEFENTDNTDKLRRVSRNYTEDSNLLPRTPAAARILQIKKCKEVYPGIYPPLFRSPAYNYFYIEVMKYGLGRFNYSLAFAIIFTWVIIWLFMIIEKLSHKKFIWNNLAPVMIAVPGCWNLLFIINIVANFTSSIASRSAFELGVKDAISSLGDGFQVALYIHSSSIGTELIHGKGLNHYASGHIDHNLNSENIWHSVILVIFSGLNSGGAALCSFVDHANYNPNVEYNSIYESTLWTIPMYSMCTSMGGYSHFVSTIVFAGLMISYATVAFVFLKTALHTIFEYKIKLVYVDQIVVGVLIMTCMLLSLVFATSGGVAVIESVDALITGIAMPFLCILEVLGLIYIYRSHDFVSDVNLATEDNQMGGRIAIIWRILPVLIVVVLVIKCTTISKTEIPEQYMYMGLVPLLAVLLAVPLRAAQNAYDFMHHTPRRGT